jgi:hypothetical protein
MSSSEMGAGEREIAAEQDGISEDERSRVS